MMQNVVCTAVSHPLEHGYFGVGDDGKIYFVDDRHVKDVNDVEIAMIRYGYPDIPIMRESKDNLRRALWLAS